MDTSHQEKSQTAPGVPADAQTTSPESVRAGHEITDVSVRGLMIFGASLLVFLVGALAVVAAFFAGFHLLNAKLDERRPSSEPGASSAVRLSADYTGPLMQVKPEEDLRWMRAHNAETLATYGWIDRTKGVVRLPVSRAMELLTERGIALISPGKTMADLQRERAQPQVVGQALRP